MKIWLAIAVLIGAALVVGCPGTTPGGNDGGEDAGDAGDDGGYDAGDDAGNTLGLVCVDGGSPIDPNACNALTFGTSLVIDEQVVASNAPNGTGGTAYDGTYYLTSL